VPKPRPEPPKKQEAFDPNRIAALLDKTPRKPQTPQPNQAEQKPDPKPASPQAATGSTAARSDQPLSMSEIDAIRTQIQRCWNVPAGARDARDLRIQIRLSLNKDGSLRGEPEIVDRLRASTDPFYRTAAESARRAVLQCSPLKNLPPDKYERWRDIELVFDPKEMLG
jgi:outer membrane biosynthesis protein TonB